MNYQEARVYLDDAAKYGSVLGLENMREMMAGLGDPQDQLKFIHISGTNGKGSVLAYLSTILKEAGYRVGRYVSPTLFSYRERIQVNEEYIKKESYARHVSAIKKVIDDMTAAGKAHPTPFEIETAVAFLYFAEEHCDIVVLETGLGGDTDATNIIRTPVMEVLVSISMDHMQFLGNTITEIARHKAGIIKPGTVVVSARQQPEAMRVIEEKAKEQRAELVKADWTQAENVRYGIKEQSFSYGGLEDLKIHLAGSYQIPNAVTAVEAAAALQKLGYAISEEHLRAGLAKTRWRGRFSVLCEKPLFIMDGAHNRDGAQMLKASIEQYFDGKRIIAICGMFRDKEYEKVLVLIAPYLSKLIAIETPGNPRALPKEELAQTAKRYLTDVECAETVADAVQTAFTQTNEEDVIVAFGSLSFLGELTKAVELIRGNKI